VYGRLVGGGEEWIPSLRSNGRWKEAALSEPNNRRGLEAAQYLCSDEGRGGGNAMVVFGSLLEISSGGTCIIIGSEYPERSTQGHLEINFSLLKNGRDIDRRKALLENQRVGSPGKQPKLIYH